MKKFNSKILIRLLLMSSSFLFYGCLNEDLVDKIQHEHKHRYDTEYVPLSKVNHIKPHVDNFVQKHTSKSSSTDHLDLNEDRILVLSDTESNYKSYSIGINNSIPENEAYYFDNLHVIEQDQIIIDNFIFRWTPLHSNTSLDLRTFTGNVKKFDVDYSLISESNYIDGILQYNNTNSSKYWVQCDISFICECKSTGSNYCACNVCPLTAVNTCRTYMDSGGGSGDGFGDGSGVGGEGGGGSGGTSDYNNNDSDTNNGDPLHPIIPLPEMELEEETPCVKLKNITTNPQLNVKNTILYDLRPNININPNGERGALLKKGAANYGYELLSATTDSEIKIKAGGLTFSAIHTHPTSTFPMFSWSDVYTLYTINNLISPTNSGILTSFMLVCKDQNGDFQTYAIVYNNEGVNTLDIAFNLTMNAGMEPAVIAADMDLKLAKEYRIQEKNGTFDYAKAFLSQFSGSNLSLYKANSTLDSWSRLHINTATNNSMEIPCE